MENKDDDDDDDDVHLAGNVVELQEALMVCEKSYISLMYGFEDELLAQL
jgi:hypothetical protein